MKKILMLLQLGLLLVSISAHSQEGAKRSQEVKPKSVAKFLIDAGAEFGGEELVKAFFTNGETATMRAGQGAYFAVGTQIEFTNAKHLMIRASIGIKHTGISADNGHIRFNRIPITLISYSKIAKGLRVGIGVTSHRNVRLKGDGFVPNIHFKSSLGLRLELAYHWFAIVYTGINYKTRAGERIAANSLGFSFSFAFPNK